MRRKPVTVNALDDQEVVAQKIAKYNLLAVPVLEEDGSVVGFVTVDDVIDVLIEEQTEDILTMAAVEPGACDQPYFDNPLVARRAQARGLAAAAVRGGNASRAPCCATSKASWRRWWRSRSSSPC